MGRIELASLERSDLNKLAFDGAFKGEALWVGHSRASRPQSVQMVRPPVHHLGTRLSQNGPRA